LKEGRLFNLTDEEFKHNVALAKSIVSVEMYSNWFYPEGLPNSKVMSSMYTERCEASILLSYLFF
jgi:hypothetical protein